MNISFSEWFVYTGLPLLGAMLIGYLMGKADAYKEQAEWLEEFRKELEALVEGIRQ